MNSRQAFERFAMKELGITAWGESPGWRIWQAALEWQSARESEGGEAIGFIPDSGLNNLNAGHPARVYPVGSMPSPFEGKTLVYAKSTPQPDKWKKITPAMIEAGAQRLVRWDEGSTWPDSWSAMDVAAARQDAERVLRSALSVAKGADDHE